LVVALCVLLFLHHCDATEYDHKVNKNLFTTKPLFWFVQLFLAVMINSRDPSTYMPFIKPYFAGPKYT
jgi:hypothetical protein